MYSYDTRILLSNVHVRSRYEYIKITRMLTSKAVKVNSSPAPSRRFTEDYIALCLFLFILIHSTVENCACAICQTDPYV